MLVLTRRRGDGIVIGSNIVITVIEIHHDRVRLGFQAPEEVSIHRHEVYARIQDEVREQLRFDPLSEPFVDERKSGT
jgi:carbon storage regulator